MEQSGLPPVIPESEPERFTVSRWRWGIHLLILTAYPITLGVLGATLKTGKGPMLPSDPLQLAGGIGGEVFIFSVIFGVALLLSRASMEDLRLRWTSPLAAVTRGFLYAIGLRIAIGLIAVVAKAMLSVLLGLQPQDIKKLNPDYEQLIDPNALVNSPFYLWMNVTVVSFLLGGLREELWRAGMLSGMAHLAPKWFSSVRGQVFAVCLAAISFGLGHLTQGWGGVLMTAFLGIGLGLIMVWHRTIWTAVFAHGFFDAASFLMIYLVTKYRPEWLQQLG
jgi:membrane protease YdiL (CAAX protease family)